MFVLSNFFQLFRYSRGADNFSDIPLMKQLRTVKRVCIYQRDIYCLHICIVLNIGVWLQLQKNDVVVMFYSTLHFNWNWINIFYLIVLLLLVSCFKSPFISEGYPSNVVSIHIYVKKCWFLYCLKTNRFEFPSNIISSVYLLSLPFCHTKESCDRLSVFTLLGVQYLLWSPVVTGKGSEFEVV